MAPPEAKRTRKRLNIQQKLDAIAKVESGWSQKQVAEHFGIGFQTMSDIMKAKPKLIQFKNKGYDIEHGGEKAGAPRKSMKVSVEEKLEDTVLKWYSQQRTAGVSIGGEQLVNAANRFATHLGIQHFSASLGWAYRFKRRHGIGKKKKVSGETLSADEESAANFRNKLLNLIADEGLLLSQIYNADETGLFFRKMPDRTFVMREEKKARGHKISKERISILCCANADGMHRLKPMVVGKARQPRCLRNLMNELPVIYDSSKNAWFTMRIFKNWFFNYFIPAVMKYQVEVLNISRDRVRALLLLDNAPAHPDLKEMVSDDGKVRCLFLPPNTTSLIQPMDQGIIVAAKRLYTGFFLNEVLCVTEGEEENKGQRTLANLKAFNILSAMHCWAKAWKQLKITTLQHGWNKLLKNEASVLDFQGFEDNVILEQLHAAGEEEVLANDVEDWMEELVDDPGYEMLTEEEIAEQVLHPPAEGSDDDSDDEATVKKVPLGEMAQYLDVLMGFVEDCSEPHITSLYYPLRQLKDYIIDRRQQVGKKQTKIDTFFRPKTPVTSPSATPPVTSPPSTSFATPQPTPSTSDTESRLLKIRASLKRFRRDSESEDSE